MELLPPKGGPFSTGLGRGGVGKGKGQRARAGEGGPRSVALGVQRGRPPGPGGAGRAPGTPPPPFSGQNIRGRAASGRWGLWMIFWDPPNQKKLPIRWGAGGRNFGFSPREGGGGGPGLSSSAKKGLSDNYQKKRAKGGAKPQAGRGRRFPGRDPKGRKRLPSPTGAPGVLTGTLRGNKRGPKDGRPIFFRQTFQIGHLHGGTFYGDLPLFPMSRNFP